MGKLNIIINEDIKNDINWFYHEVRKTRHRFKEDEIRSLFNEIQKRIDKAGICSPKIVVDHILNIKDQQKRRKYVLLANKIATNSGMSNSEVHQLLVSVSKKFLIKEFSNPAEALMSRDFKKISKRILNDDKPKKRKKAKKN